MQGPSVINHTSARPLHRTHRGAWLFGVLFVLGAIAILIVPLFVTGSVALNSGDVAPEDIRAPRSVRYVSEILTNQARDEAERSVPVQYDPLDLRVARQQVTRARDVIDYLRAVRADPLATRDDKRVMLSAIENFSLAPETIDQLLDLPDAEWENFRNEIVAVIDLAMRNEIRDVNLEEVKARLPALVAIDLNEKQTRLVSQVAQNFIVPNRARNDAATEQARQTAREQVEPRNRGIETGQTIVRQGDLVTALQLEALEQLNLRQAQVGGNDVAGFALATLLAALLLGLYLWRIEPALLNHPRTLLLLTLLLLAFLLLAKIMVPGRAVLPFVFPAAALSMLITIAISPGLAMMTTMVLAGLVGLMANSSLEVATYVAASGLIAILTLNRGERLNALFWSGVYVIAANVLVLMTFRLPAGGVDPIGSVQLFGAAVLNGALSASLTLISLFLIGDAFDVTTAVQLLELARPTHPLLNDLLHKAPGTYHHTLMVANLAEQAAERIGANSMLTRVGAYYHDVGKTMRPYMFVENQVEGANVHDQFEPRTSAEIIVSHVTEGLELAKKYRLPTRVRAFIPEHHGTMRVSFLYQKAVAQAAGANNVDESSFRYPGPKPQTKETALLMLADGCEAAVRANRPESPDQLNEVVRRVITDRITWGQLDECPLTLGELDKVRASFVATLQGIYHPRLRYPGQEPKTEPAPRVARQAEPEVDRADQSPNGDQPASPETPDDQPEESAPRASLP